MTERVKVLLAQHGATLVRWRKHNIYRFPNGRTVVISKTPSDWRAEMKQIRDIRRAIGEVQ